MYDLYVPMVQEEHVQIRRERALKWSGWFRPLGEQYLTDLNKSLNKVGLTGWKIGVRPAALIHGARMASILMF